MLMALSYCIKQALSGASVSLVPPVELHGYLRTANALGKSARIWKPACGWQVRASGGLLCHRKRKQEKYKSNE